MFKGSENVGAGEHPVSDLHRTAASMNGTTNKDRTLYYEILPANQLDLALFLEADRMRSLDDHQGESRQPAQRRPGRAPARRRQPALRQDVRGARRARLRELRLRALGHRLDGRSQRRDASTTSRRSSRPTTRPTTPSLAIVGDVDTKATLEKVREVLRVDSVAAGAAARRHDRAAADRRAARDARGRAGAADAHRHGLQDSAELVARRRCAARCWRPMLSGGRSVAVLRGDRPAEAAGDRA